MTLVGSGNFKEFKFVVYAGNGKFYAYLGEFSPEAGSGMGETPFQAIANLCYKIDNR